MLVVRKLAGLASIQDRGRVGLASHGVPRGGALVRALASRANAAVGNGDDAACVEILGRLVLAAERDVVVATERDDARTLRAGDELVVEPDPRSRARYVAIAGGVDAPLVLGSRAPLALCGIDHALRVGDRIAALAPAPAVPAPRAASPFDAKPDVPIAIVAGPDDPHLARALASAPWRIATASDRTGTRLEGRAMDEAGGTGRRPSSPMVPGAIQLPSGGAPIVIGPDGPTTGGYPIVAVVADADLDRFCALPLGAPVSFVVA